jgi:hypothetical protein
MRYYSEEQIKDALSMWSNVVQLSTFKRLGEPVELSITSEEERRVWMMCYVEYKKTGASNSFCLSGADQDLEAFKKRFSNEQ